MKKLSTGGVIFSAVFWLCVLAAMTDEDMSAGYMVFFLAFYGGVFWGILRLWNWLKGTKKQNGNAASAQAATLPVPESPIPPPPPPNPATPGETIAVLSKTLAHMLETSKQVGIATPEALEQRIRALCKDCEKHISESGKNERLCIAVAGKFSCGKSQFINSLTGCDLAPVDAMRTTCCKTTFTGDPSSERIRVVEAATGKEISQEEYRDRAAKRSASENDFIVYLPGRNWEDVALVDTPGFDPPEGEIGEDGGTTDERISREAVSNADVVFFLLDINSGTLPADSKDYLIEIAKTNSHLYLVLNKADDKSPKARENIMREVSAKCVEYDIAYESVMPYISLTEKCKELQQKPETARRKTLADAAELREKVKDGLVALRRRKEQILGGRRTGVQSALLARLEKEATTAMKLFGTGIRLLETEATSVDTVDVDEVVAKVLDTLTRKAKKWLQTNPLFLKYVSVERNKFRSLSLFCKAYVVCLTEPPVVQEKDFSSTEDALRQVLGEVYPAFVGCEKSVAKLLKNAELVLQSMIPEENGTSITLNDYCEHCDWESEIPDARDKIRNKIQVDFPDLFVSKCSSATRQTIQKAWTEHLEYRRRAIEQKTQPLKNDIATICELLNQQTERT